MSNSYWLKIISLLHQRFVESFSIPLAQLLQRTMQPTPKAQLNAMSNEQRDREETARLSRQRTIGRIVVDLWLVGVFSGLTSSKEKDRSASNQLERADEQMIWQIYHDLVSIMIELTCMF
jgi:regulator of nonsense transcripts 2